ncbi:MAG: hypothetical protein JXR14_05240 [Paracoccaceae bacterium]
MTSLLAERSNSWAKSLGTALFISLFSVPSHAQFAHFARDAALTPDDIGLAKDSAKALYTKPGVQPGETLYWENEESGARGLVEVVAVEEAGRCVVLRHFANTRRKPEIRYYVRRCRDVNGRWLLSAN